MSPNPESYWASFVSSYRKLHNLTQEDLAARLNVSQQTVSRWEAGQQVPDATSQAVLKQVLGEADFGSKKLLIERVRQSSGCNLLLNSNAVVVAASGAVASAINRDSSREIEVLHLDEILPLPRPGTVEMAARAGLFDGRLMSVSFTCELGFATGTQFIFTEIWPALTHDGEIFAHAVMHLQEHRPGQGEPGTRVTGLTVTPNTLVQF